MVISEHLTDTAEKMTDREATGACLENMKAEIDGAQEETKAHQEVMETYLGGGVSQ